MSVQRNEQLVAGQPQISLRGVSRQYELQQTRHRSFQESFIHLFRGKRDERHSFWPLRDISFSIYPGERVGIIGPNGSGKSTLLKLMSSVIIPSTGDLIINGRISRCWNWGPVFTPT